MFWVLSIYLLALLIFNCFLVLMAADKTYFTSHSREILTIKSYTMRVFTFVGPTVVKKLNRNRGKIRLLYETVSETGCGRAHAMWRCEDAARSKTWIGWANRWMTLCEAACTAEKGDFPRRKAQEKKKLPRNRYIGDATHTAGRRWGSVLPAHLHSQQVSLRVSFAR